MRVALNMAFFIASLIAFGCDGGGTGGGGGSTSPSTTGNGGDGGGDSGGQAGATAGGGLVGGGSEGGGGAGGGDPEFCPTGCDDNNDCTNDVCYPDGCKHFALDHLHSCNQGAGFCDGNIPACCTTFDVECCKGCKLLVDGVTTCVEQCPAGMKCAPITVECN